MCCCAIVYMLEKNSRENKAMTYSVELQNALDAMRKIRKTADMNVLAQQFNSHINFLGKINGAGVVVGKVTA